MHVEIREKVENAHSPFLVKTIALIRQTIRLLFSFVLLRGIKKSVISTTHVPCFIRGFKYLETINAFACGLVLSSFSQCFCLEL